MTLKTEISANNLSYIKISGPDAETFLQGQVTVNLSTLTEGDIRYCCQCNAKGKMVGLGFLFYQNDDYYFIQSTSGIASSLAQFKKFGVFAKVEFFVPDHTSRCIAVLSNVNSYDDILFDTPALPGAEQYSLIWVHESQLALFSFDALDNALNSGLNSAQFETYLIQRGVPLLCEGMTEQWVPQMFNVQALNGIDFDKGCYMGQEVVARTRYLGKNKRALYAFTIDDSLAAQIEINSSVFRKMGENWRKSGTVINCASGEGKLWLLVVLPNDINDHDKIGLDDGGKLLASPFPLPYVVELEESSIKKRK